MKSNFYPCLASLLLLAAALRGAESMDEAMNRATLDYDQRLTRATEELIKTRERIAGEKNPLLQQMRTAEDRIIAADTEITRLETGQEQSAENHRRLAKEAEAMRRNESYLNTLAHDSLTVFADGLLPGQKQFLSGKIETLQEPFDAPAKFPGSKQAADVADFLTTQIQRALGGYAAAGNSLINGEGSLVKGTFAFVGPEVFFRVDQGGAAGTVRTREGTDTAVTYLLPDWKPAVTEALFQGRPGPIPVDASAGKALRLRETKGTVWQHINKGGVVSYAIIAVGVIALMLIVQKIFDLSRMGMGNLQTVQQCLDAVATDQLQEAGKLVRSLKRTPHELFASGLRYREESKAMLEERLTAILLRQRLHYERWLPLLAVLATAAPLMGLLGTVTGMVRTFTLITVFGTGNAGKLAGGISEVLVATELGLLVAIPTLVAHGFLSQRIQKNLSLLERYALEFTTAVQAGKFRTQTKESIPA